MVKTEGNIVLWLSEVRRLLLMNFSGLFYLFCDGCRQGYEQTETLPVFD